MSTNGHNRFLEGVEIQILIRGMSDDGGSQARAFDEISWEEPQSSDA